MLDIKKSDYLAIDDRITSRDAPGTGRTEPSEPVLEIDGDGPSTMEPVRKADIAGTCAEIFGLSV